jgi:hypothetical protein
VHAVERWQGVDLFFAGSQPGTVLTWYIGNGLSDGQLWHEPYDPSLYLSAEQIVQPPLSPACLPEPGGHFEAEFEQP